MPFDRMWLAPEGYVDAVYVNPPGRLIFAEYRGLAKSPGAARGLEGPWTQGRCLVLDRIRGTGPRERS